MILLNYIISKQLVCVLLIQLTHFNSNLQGDKKIVRVNESSSYRMKKY